MCSHSGKLMRVSFSAISIWMLVGFVISREEFDEGDDNGFNHRLDAGMFIMLRFSSSVLFYKRDVYKDGGGG